MSNSIMALEQAARGMFQARVTYTKETTGETKSYWVGVYEITGEVVWVWDLDRNDNIRQFKLSNVGSVEVLAAPFVRPQAYPIKLYGEIIIP